MLLDNDRNRLRHMLDGALLAMEYTKRRQLADLEEDVPFRYFLMKNLEIIGEAASRVSREFQLAHPDIPWREMISLRNHLVHVYFDVDQEIIWRTTMEFLPQVAQQLEKLLHKE